MWQSAIKYTYIKYNYKIYATYGKLGNVNFESKLEKVQCNACLAIPAGNQGTNKIVYM